MKKLLTLTFVFLLCLSFTSALDFDNSLTYENEDRTAVITNAFGLGEILGKAELKSHSTPTEIKKVIQGKDRLVMYYDFTNWKLYEDGLGEVSFIDMYSEKEIQKDYYFAKAIYEDVEVNEFKNTCPEEILFNGSIGKNCINELIGSHTENKIVRWERLENNDIPEEDVRIGLFTDVNSKDYIDGVWTIAGKKVEKHAWWIDTAPTHYWKFNEGSGNAFDTLGVINLTNTGITYAAGKLNNASTSAGSSANFIAQGAFTLGTNDFTIAFWMKSTSEATGILYGPNGVWVSPTTFGSSLNGGGAGLIDLQWSGGSVTSTIQVHDGAWHRIVVRRRGTGANELEIFIDGNSTPNAATTCNVNFASETLMFFDNTGVAEYVGSLDDFQLFNGFAWSDADIVEDWNGGDGREADEVVSPPSFTTIPDNATINYTQGFGVDFDGVNVDTWFINWTDTFQINQSGFLENASSNLEVGTYFINVSINNTENLINSTTYKVVVNQAVPSGTLSGTTPIEFPLVGDVEGTESNTGDGDISYKLYRDSLEVSNPDTTVLGAGTYNYIYNATSGQNYTVNSSLDTFELVVNKNDSLTLGLTGTTPVEYPATTDFVGSGCPAQLTCTLNLTNQEFTAGVVNANYSTSGNVNYTATSSVFAITINKNSSTTLEIAGTTPITYGSVTDVAGSNCPAQLTCTLDKSNIVYSAGSQLFNYSTSGNTNYSATSNTINITINKDIPQGSLTSSLGWTINESQEVTIGFSESNNGDEDLTYLVYRDNVSKGSGETVSLPSGIYNYVLNTTGGQNWTENISMNTQVLTVIDVNNPLVEFTSPTNNSNFTTPQITLNISIVESNPGVCIWSEDSFSTNNTITCGNNITSRFSQGTNVIDFWMNDTFGNNNRTSISFNVDSINLISPVDNLISEVFNVEFNCNFSLANNIKNVSIFTNSSGDFIPVQTLNTLDGNAYGDEYYLLIQADDLSISDLEINDVIVTKVNSLQWKINTTNASDEVSRALIMKTLFYGTDGTDPRINSTQITNLEAIYSSDPRDIGKRGTSVIFDSTSQSGSSYTGTFDDTTNNIGSSIWSKVHAKWVGAQGGTLIVRSEFPEGTTINTVSVGGNGEGTVDELGTDRSADEQDNPADVQIQVEAPGVGELTEDADLIILHTGNISWSLSGAATVSQIDFKNNYSIPDITFEGNRTFIPARWNITITEPTLWSCQACDVDDDCFLATENRTVSIDSTLPQINLDEPRGLLDYTIFGNGLSINWTVSDINLDKCWYNYNNINTTVTCSDNSTTLTLVKGLQSLIFYANDTLDNKNSNLTSWTYKVLQNNVSFDQSVYETSKEEFVLNITSDGTQTVLATLNYNGTDYTSTKTGDNTNMIFTNNINIPTTYSGNVSFYWKINYGSEIINTNNYEHTISPIQLGLCNSTLNVTYLNFTFKDEETLTSLNSTMDLSNWRYYLGDGTIYNEFNFQNTSENPSYGFCFSPSDKTFSSTSTSFRYSASGYPQRIHTASSDLSNTTTNQLLYLLATADGSYVTIITQNAYGTPIQDVQITVERQFSGVYTTIGQDDTDSSGSSTFWLNPDYDHRFTLSKSGIATQILEFRPTASSYTVVFGETNTSEAEYTSSVKGVDYSISPVGYTILNQSQSYEFQFNVSANQSNLVSYLFNITDFDGNLLGSNGGSIATGGDNSIILNTGENKSFHAYYFIDTGSGIVQVSTNTYSIILVNASSGSLIKAINNWDINNQDKDEQFSYFFWFFFIIFLLLAALTKFTGADIVQPGTILLLIGSGVFILSLANFFTITFTSNDFINQFGVASTVLLAIAGFIIGQINRT